MDSTDKTANKNIHTYTLNTYPMNTYSTLTQQWKTSETTNTKGKVGNI